MRIKILAFLGAFKYLCLHASEINLQNFYSTNCTSRGTSSKFILAATNEIYLVIFLITIFVLE